MASKGKTTLLELRFSPCYQVLKANIGGKDRFKVEFFGDQSYSEVGSKSLEPLSYTEKKAKRKVRKWGLTA